MNKSMLQNSLIGRMPFYNVKATEDLEDAKGRTAIDYDAYVGVVQQVSGNYINRYPFKKQNDIQ